MQLTCISILAKYYSEKLKYISCVIEKLRKRNKIVLGRCPVPKTGKILKFDKGKLFLRDLFTQRKSNIVRVETSLAFLLLSRVRIHTCFIEVVCKPTSIQKIRLFIYFLWLKYSWRSNWFYFFNESLEFERSENSEWKSQLSMALTGFRFRGKGL